MNPLTPFLTIALIIGAFWVMTRLEETPSTPPPASGYYRVHTPQGWGPWHGVTRPASTEETK